MTPTPWTPRQRPTAERLPALGIRCRCGRRMYVDVGPELEVIWNVNGQVSRTAKGEREYVFCRGCDEVASACYCPPALEAV